MRGWASNSPVYSTNNVLREVVHVCFDFIKANKAYAKNPASFTSKPQLPGYLPKQGLHTVSIPNDDCVLTTMDKLWRSKREGAQTATINSTWEDFISLEHKNKVVYFSGSGLCCDVGQTYGHRIAEVKIEHFHNAFLSEFTSFQKKRSMTPLHLKLSRKKKRKR